MNDVTELVNITWTASSCSYLHIQLRPPALPLPSADLQGTSEMCKAIYTFTSTCRDVKLCFTSDIPLLAIF